MLFYPYLEDAQFLTGFDELNFKEEYIRIMVLDMAETKVLANIEGKCTGGNCNLSGTSNMRRTASVTVAVDPQGININGRKVDYNNILEVENIISMNKKIRIEKGFTNTTDKYTDYSIIWFPLGVYGIQNANVSRSMSGLNISLTLQDKCCFLNGTLGGIIPAATIFSESELYNRSYVAKATEKILIKDIIRALVIEFGGESPDKVFVQDIPNSIKKVMKWTGNSPLYLITSEEQKQYTTTRPEGYEYISFNYGEDVGYMVEPFVYPGELGCNAGDSVAAMLDKIKNALGGNYEWFYDIWGNFHFQEKKNFLNTSVASSLLRIHDSDYFNTVNYNLPAYSLNSKRIVTAIANNPQYANIKNDYVVWGMVKTATGQEKPIRYHMSFRTKPTVRTDPMLAVVYNDWRGLQHVVPLIEGQTYIAEKPNKDSNKTKYYLKDGVLYYWKDNGDMSDFVQINAQDNYENCEVCYLLPHDWRTELYFQGLEADNKTFYENYYAAELNAEWGKLCNVRGKEQGTKQNEEGQLFNVYKSAMRDIKESSYEYWLDFLEGDNECPYSISPYLESNIGRRTVVVNEGNVNCIFPTEIPNYIIVAADGDTSDETNLDAATGYEVIQVGTDIYSKMVLGGSSNSAFEKIQELLYNYSSYNETIQLTVLPIYHLEPNTRLLIYDNDSAVGGEYLINSISLPLAPGGTSTISCVKTLQKEQYQEDILPAGYVYYTDKNGQKIITSLNEYFAVKEEV